MVEKYPSVIFQMAFLGTEEDVISLAEVTKDILNKFPHERSLEELEFLADMIARIRFKQRFCGHFDTAKLQQLLRHVKYRDFPGNHAVFVEGEETSKVYILLSGKVSG